MTNNYDISLLKQDNGTIKISCWSFKGTIKQAERFCKELKEVIKEAKKGTK